MLGIILDRRWGYRYCVPYGVCSQTSVYGLFSSIIGSQRRYGGEETHSGMRRRELLVLLVLWLWTKYFQSCGDGAGLQVGCHGPVLSLRPARGATKDTARHLITAR